MPPELTGAAGTIGSLHVSRDRSRMSVNPSPCPVCKTAAETWGCAGAPWQHSLVPGVCGCRAAGWAPTAQGWAVPLCRGRWVLRPQAGKCGEHQGWRQEWARESWWVGVGSRSQRATGKEHPGGATVEQHRGLGEMATGWLCPCGQAFRTVQYSFNNVYFCLSKELGFNSDSRDAWCLNSFSGLVFFLSLNIRV